MLPSPSSLKKRANHLEHWVLSPREPQGPWLKRVAHRLARIAYAVGRDVLTGDLTLHAMGLVYTTLLSIVPLLALSFSVLKAMGVHNQIEPFLYQFFQPMGKQGIEMADKIISFVDNVKVGVLGSLGLLLLVYTVVSLIQKIERSFNMIWRVPQMRSLAQRFSNYLSVILIGPLLMVSAVGVTASIFSSDVVQGLLQIEPFGSLILMGSKLMPFLLVIGAFTFVYAFIPNTKVRVRSAAIGGVIAGIAWQAGGFLFASFVVGSSRYEAIYSSFAIGILLLIWVYISWMVLLIGASISFYDQHNGAVSRSRTVMPSAELDERVALAMMWMVADAFDNGHVAPQQENLEQRMRIPAQTTRRISDKLLKSGLLTLGGEAGDRLLPGRSLDRITLLDVLHTVRRDEEGLSRRLPAAIPDAWCNIDNDGLRQTLKDWVRGPDEPTVLGDKIS